MPFPFQRNDPGNESLVPLVEKIKRKKQKEIASTGFTFCKVRPSRNIVPGSASKEQQISKIKHFKKAHVWRTFKIQKQRESQPTSRSQT